MAERTLTLPIRALGKQRARRGKGGVWYTPERTRALEKQIAAEWMAARLGRLSGPLSLSVLAQYAPPKSWSKARRETVMAYWTWYEGKPDGDNALKLIADALNGVAYADDRQIAEASIRQIYAPADRLTIELREMVDA